MQISWNGWKPSSQVKRKQKTPLFAQILILLNQSKPFREHQFLPPAPSASESKVSLETIPAPSVPPPPPKVNLNLQPPRFKSQSAGAKLLLNIETIYFCHIFLPRARPTSLLVPSVAKHQNWANIYFRRITAWRIILVPDKRWNATSALHSCTEYTSGDFGAWQSSPVVHLFELSIDLSGCLSALWATKRALLERVQPERVQLERI